MGDPKHPKKKYNTPRHPWEKERIETEKVLMSEYGLSNKKEIWRANSLLSKFKSQAKKCAAADTAQLKKESEQLLTRLKKFGLLKTDDTLDDVLGLSVDDLLQRRLQTIVFKKKLASSVKQGRQFIVHGHVIVNSKKVTVPSYMVSLDEESKISITGVVPEQKK